MQPLATVLTLTPNPLDVSVDLLTGHRWPLLVADGAICSVELLQVLLIVDHRLVFCHLSLAAGTRGVLSGIGKLTVPFQRVILIVVSHVKFSRPLSFSSTKSLCARGPCAIYPL